MTKYQKEHYEDVAQLLRDHAASAEPAVQDLALAFANVFTADNPRICLYCCRADKETTQFCTDPGEGHTFSGFDRELFLAACGLKS